MPLFMEENNPFWQLLARYLSGEASASEKETLQQMLADDPVLRHAATVVGAVWENQALPDAAGVQERASSLLDRIKKGEVS